MGVTGLALEGGRALIGTVSIGGDSAGILNFEFFFDCPSA
jgi:hypothetical protein